MTAVENVRILPNQRFTSPVGASPAFDAALDLARRLAPSDLSLTLIGETGSGKEVFARMVHEKSVRSGGPFVAVNCGSLPPTLLEAELFGWVEGAFTGATRSHRGLFEQADGGTLFLDEIGEMPLAMQAAILRALESGEIRAVGDTRARRVDVRIVCATHRDLATMVGAGTFRADLSYRIAAATISIPPLRERAEDVLQLAHHFLGTESRRTGRRVLGFSPEALEALAAYRFPGNVRELKNEISRAVALTADGALVAAESFSEHVAVRPSQPSCSPKTLKEIVERAERYAVELALLRAKGSVTQAARDLGLSRTGLYKVMLRLGVR